MKPENVAIQNIFSTLSCRAVGIIVLFILLAHFAFALIPNQLQDNTVVPKLIEDPSTSSIFLFILAFCLPVTSVMMAARYYFQSSSYNKIRQHAALILLLMVIAAGIVAYLASGIIPNPEKSESGKFLIDFYDLIGAMLFAFLAIAIVVMTGRLTELVRIVFTNDRSYRVFYKAFNNRFPKLRRQKNNRFSKTFRNLEVQYWDHLGLSAFVWVFSTTLGAFKTVDVVEKVIEKRVESVIEERIFDSIYDIQVVALNRPSQPAALLEDPQGQNPIVDDDPIEDEEGEDRSQPLPQIIFQWRPISLPDIWRILNVDITTNKKGARQLSWHYFYDRGRLASTSCQHTEFKSGENVMFGSTYITDAAVSKQIKGIVKGLAICAVQGDQVKKISLELSGFASSRPWRGCEMESTLLNLKLAKSRRDKLHRLLSSALENEVYEGHPLERLFDIKVVDYKTTAEMDVNFGRFSDRVTQITNQLTAQPIDDFLQVEPSQYDFKRAARIVALETGFCEVPTVEYSIMRP